MPPKVKVTQDQIIQAAMDIVRESGIDALNARALAKQLDCSIQPITSISTIRTNGWASGSGPW